MRNQKVKYWPSSLGQSNNVKNVPVYTPGIEPAPREYPMRSIRKRNFFLGQTDTMKPEIITGLIVGGLVLLAFLGRRK